MVYFVTLLPNIPDKLLEEVYVLPNIASELIVTSVKIVVPLKAELPMVVTELGMVTEDRPEQPQKAELPMLVTELPMVTEVRPEQLEKA